MKSAKLLKALNFLNENDINFDIKDNKFILYDFVIHLFFASEKNVNYNSEEICYRITYIRKNINLNNQPWYKKRAAIFRTKIKDFRNESIFYILQNCYSFEQSNMNSYDNYHNEDGLNKIIIDFSEGNKEQLDNFYKYYNINEFINDVIPEHELSSIKLHYLGLKTVDLPIKYVRNGIVLTKNLIINIKKLPEAKSISTCLILTVAVKESKKEEMRLLKEIYEYNKWKGETLLYNLQSWNFNNSSLCSYDDYKIMKLQNSK